MTDAELETAIDEALAGLVSDVAARKAKLLSVFGTETRRLRRIIETFADDVDPDSECGERASNRPPDGALVWFTSTRHLPLGHDPEHVFDVDLVPSEPESPHVEPPCGHRFITVKVTGGEPAGKVVCDTCGADMGMPVKVETDGT